MSVPRPRRSTFLLLSLLSILLLATPLFAQEQPEKTAEEAPATPAPTQRVVDEITVTATRTPRRILDTAGNVSVLSGEEIEERMLIDRADLVRYEPGVFVGNDPTRLGLNGFNIRGIGGNRVLTQVDGIRTAEQFDFGPLGIPQIGIDIDALDSVEIVRSAGSSLYGSDALGGVVSLMTKDPSDYLAFANGDFFAQARGTYDSRSDERSESATVAGRFGRIEASLFASRRDGEAARNKGSIDAANSTRTKPNPIERGSTSALGKVTFAASDSNRFELGFEVFDAGNTIDYLSGQGIQDLSSTMPPGSTYTIDTRAFTADDRQKRQRVSLEESLTSTSGNRLYDSLLWRAYSETSETEQFTDELRVTTMGGGPLGPMRTTSIARDAVFSFDQDRYGAEVQLNRGLNMKGSDHLLTWGGSYTRNAFDMLRGRVDINTVTGAVVPGSSPYPTKYFPASTVTEAGLYVQDEIVLRSGSLRVIPGLRYDRYSLSPDRNDRIYLDGNPGSPLPEKTSVGALSPKLSVIQRIGENVSAFVQYARGFRSPPYSDVNNGFTNLTFGYTTLPNPDLEPETSNNLEIGVRAATARFGASLVVFDNRFDDFIETVTIGTNEQGLLVYQPQNVAEARISGIELSGEALLGRGWQLRGSAAALRGDNEVADVPLNSIPPAQLSLGLRYNALSSRWGSEVAVTFAAAKNDDDIDTSIVNQFATPSYQLVDATAFFDINSHFRVQLGAFNLLDQKYWRWNEVQGVRDGSPVLDRYTSQGRSASVSLRVRL